MYILGQGAWYWRVTLNKNGWCMKAVPFKSSIPPQVLVLAPGEAIENGQFGDLIQVRNSASSQVLRGFVSTQIKLRLCAKLK